jgi:lysosome membrane protein 2
VLINDGIGYDDDHQERIHRVGHIERFNFETNITFWSDEYANMINGTDSTLWHPIESKLERIFTFMPDVCRSIYLEYNETLENRFNIDTYRYTLSDSVFANSSDNRGFCLNSTSPIEATDVQCLPAGLFTLSRCVHRERIVERDQIRVRTIVEI